MRLHFAGFSIPRGSQCYLISQVRGGIGRRACRRVHCAGEARSWEGGVSEYSEYIRTRPLSWWRAYMKGAFGVWEAAQDHAITREEKRRLFRAAKHNLRFYGSVGSFTALAIVERSLGGKAS
jgi:hypothetical protein